MYHVRLCKAPIAGLPKAKGLQNACHRHILDLQDSVYQARSDVVIVGRGPSIATVMSQQTWPIDGSETSLQTPILVILSMCWSEADKA